MDKMILLAGSRRFSDEIEVCDNGHINILDCKVTIINMFSKLLSKVKLAVYGNYDIYILYSIVNLEKVNNYKVNIINRTFSNIISYENELKGNDKTINSENLTEQIIFQPCCKYYLNNRLSNSAANKIIVFGDMEVIYSIDWNSYMGEKKEQYLKKHKVVKKNNPTQIQAKEKEKDDNLIKELLDMDLEALKEIVKINYLPSQDK